MSHHLQGIARWPRVVAGSLIAIGTRSPRFHGTFAVAALLYELSWIWRRYEVLI